MTVNPDLESLTVALRQILDLYFDPEILEPARYREMAQVLRDLSLEIDGVAVTAEKRAP